MGKHEKMIAIMSDPDLMNKIVSHFKLYSSKTATARKFGISFYAVCETLEQYKTWKEAHNQANVAEY